MGFIPDKLAVILRCFKKDKEGIEMKITTLSFQLDGDRMSLSGKERAEYICRLALDIKPELLACAGWSVNSRNDVSLIVAATKKLESTSILVEVQNDDSCTDLTHPLKHLYETGNQIPNHVMYSINRGRIKRLGPQYFSTTNELQRKNGGIERIGVMEANIDSRTFEIRNNLKAFTLCCGEIGIVSGRNNVECRSEIVRSMINGVDVIVNPTHDRMSNGGTLKAKRKYLSSSKNSAKVYVSISNWNIKKRQSTGKVIRQSQEARTLHSVFVNGNELGDYQRKCVSGIYECRSYDLANVP
jgi:hypothetical protein